MNLFLHKNVTNNKVLKKHWFTLNDFYYSYEEEKLLFLDIWIV